MRRLANEFLCRNPIVIIHLLRSNDGTLCIMCELKLGRVPMQSAFVKRSKRLYVNVFLRIPGYAFTCKRLQRLPKAHCIGTRPFYLALSCFSECGAPKFVGPVRPCASCPNPKISECYHGVLTLSLQRCWFSNASEGDRQIAVSTQRADQSMH